MIAEGGNKHILVVDDDPNIRRFLSESLRLHGYEVHSFEDGTVRQATRFWRTGTPFSPVVSVLDLDRSPFWKYS